MPKPDAVSRLLYPRNVVLVGASDRPGHWSGRVRSNLARLAFPGAVLPVNPNRAEIWGGRCHPSLAALPEPPDHLAIFVPAEAALEVLQEAGGLGARGATIYAAGFGEGGEAAGRERARRLRDVLEGTGIAAAGPNCMGIACGRSRLVTHADETLQPLALGPVAVLTQSGALVSSISRALTDRGLGVSHLISAGNQTGLTLADYIDHLADDADVKVVLAYIEAIPDAERFLAATARARGAGKIVVTLKIGGSERSRAAALAHTGSLAGSLEAFDAIAGAAGVIRVDSLEEMIEAAEYLSRASLPAGPNVAFVTNSGALKSLMSEAAERHGLALASLSEATQAAIGRALGGEVTATNPLDTRSTLPTPRYMACVEALASAPEVDLLVLIEELPREAGVARKVENFRALEACVAAGNAAGRPTPVAVLSPLTSSDTPYMSELRAELGSLPFLRALDVSMRMIAALTRTVPGPVAPAARSCDPAAPRPPRVLAALREQARSLTGPTALDEARSKELLRAYGIATPPERHAATERDVQAAAREIGFPVVLKAVSAAVPHKSDAGLVALAIADEAALARQVEAMGESCRRLGVRPDGFIVARHMRGGVEMVLGLNRDAEMGPVLMVGMGGVWLELFKDVAFAPPSLDRAGARAAIERTRARRLLSGYRGSPQLDVAALADAMVALGRLALDLGGCVQSVDINPILVMEEGAVALDGLVVLRPAL